MELICRCDLLRLPCPFDAIVHYDFIADWLHHWPGSDDRLCLAPDFDRHHHVRINFVAFKRCEQ